MSENQTWNLNEGTYGQPHIDAQNYIREDRAFRIIYLINF